jgi:hypothetical protein
LRFLRAFPRWLWRRLKALFLSHPLLFVGTTLFNPSIFSSLRFLNGVVIGVDSIEPLLFSETVIVSLNCPDACSTTSELLDLFGDWIVFLEIDVG